MNSVRVAFLALVALAVVAIWMDMGTPCSESGRAIACQGERP